MNLSRSALEAAIRQGLQRAAEEWNGETFDGHWWDLTTRCIADCIEATEKALSEPERSGSVGEAVGWQEVGT